MSAMQLGDDILFTSQYIGKMKIKNRFVRSACFERGANEDGTIKDEMIPLYERLAKGGAGLVVTGYSYIHPTGRCSFHQTGIHDDRTIPGLKKLAGAFHRADHYAKIAIQIVHGGRQVRPYAAEELVAPSAVPINGMTPRELKAGEIEELIGAFIQAAIRAKKAGFDAVQLHAAHGFLISEFNSSFTNRRTDKWGGTLENRGRFFIEIIKGIRSELGPDYPIIAKMNGSDFLQETSLFIEDAVEIARAAEKAGLDAIEISGGMSDTPADKGAIRPGIDRRSKEAYFLPQVKIIKKELKIPVIIVGGIRSAQVARKIIRRRQADFIALGRPFIREPDLPNKFRKGTVRASCVSCNGCLINTGELLACTLDS